MMQHLTSRYYFRKRDYLKIRNWYEMAKNNYVPEDTILTKKSQKSKQSHYKFQFRTIDLTQQYAHSILKEITSIKQVIILASIFQKSLGYVVSYGREMIRQGTFNLSTYSINLEDQVTIYFYIDDVTPKDYQFSLDLQVVTHEGNYFKLGSCRFSLNLNKEVTKNQTVLFSNNYKPFSFQESDKKSKAAKKQKEQQMMGVGAIQIQQQLDEIKDISKYLPPLQIIDHHSKLAPANNFNLKKKKEQLVLENPFKVTLESLLIKIINPIEMKKQILSNNPFTMNHKELISFEIKEYSIVLDMHNGWKFLNQNKNNLTMQLVIESEQDIYISSKQTQKINLSYFDTDYCLFVIILKCKVQFKLKEQSNQKRLKEFILGWLPLPLDLSIRQNKMDMFFVNDHPFPASLHSHLSIQSNFTANFNHPLYQKYKGKQDDRKVSMDELPIPQTTTTKPNIYIKTNKPTKSSQAFSTTELIQRQAHIDTQIESLKNLIEKNEQQIQRNRLVHIYGRAHKREEKINKHCELNIEQCVGKILKLKIEMKYLIPETQVPSSYYLPKRLEGTLFCLRSRHKFNCHITENQVKYHIPISLNCTKSSFSMKIHIQSIHEFQSVVNSQIVITLYEQGTFIMYSKAAIDILEVLTQQKKQSVSYVQLTKWEQQSEKYFGTIIINSIYQFQKISRKNTKGQQFQVEVQKLPMQQRLKLRIGNFKGDDDVKNRAVAIMKQNKHKQYVSNAVLSQFMSEGEIIYQLGVNSHYLLSFTNQDKSENNVFTFHIDCPYAQLVNNEEEYRSVVSSLNIEGQNYKNLQFIMKQQYSQSYYQTTLQYNQSIGLLVRLNVNELKQGYNLRMIQLVVKRNTLENKKIILQCTYKEPLVWDVVQSFNILQNNINTQQRIAVMQQMQHKYKDITILNENIKYDSRNKQIIFLRYGLSTYELLCIVTPNHSKIKKIVILKTTFLPGKNIQVFAGQKVNPSINFQNKFPVQIIRSESKEVHIASKVRFNLPVQNISQNIFIQFLKPVKDYSVIISTFDISGQRLWSYLLKVNSQLSSNYQKMEISEVTNISFPLNCENPYACKSKFNLFSISTSLKLSQSEIQIDPYDSRTIFCKIDQWSLQGESIFIFMNDKRGNIIITTQITLLPKDSIIYQNT